MKARYFSASDILNLNINKRAAIFSTFKLIIEINILTILSRHF